VEVLSFTMIPKDLVMRLALKNQSFWTIQKSTATRQNDLAQVKLSQ
jgi:hypothetical protein